MNRKNTLAAYEYLKSLDISSNDYALFDSTCLQIHKILRNVGDIDIIARGEAWEKFQKIGTAGTPKSGIGHKVSLSNYKIEVFDEWGPKKWNTNKLIDEAEEINGLRFVNLVTVLENKKFRTRPKDIRHVALIEKYLSQSD